MRRVASKQKSNKSDTSSGRRKEGTTTVETFIQKIKRAVTPGQRSKATDTFLQDERFDLMPKTDYTYARSGSYSPRFFNRKVVNPNMSRYRIHGRRSTAQSGEVQDDVVSEVHTEEFSDEELAMTAADSRLLGGAEDKSDSEYSYETVLEDGIKLRSGHSLQTMRSIFHEHDANSGNEDVHTDANVYPLTERNLKRLDKNRNAMTARKVKKSTQTSKQRSQSERKRYSTSGADSFTNNNTSREKTTITSRRNLSKDLDTTFSRTHTNGYSKTNTDNHSRSLKYDQTDSRLPGSSLRTVRKTVTETYEEVDGGLEKGSIEPSEKLTRAQLLSSQKQNINHLYGLDSEEEFSDSGSSSWRSRSRSQYRDDGSAGYSASSASMTTTVITTIVETITTIASPIIIPVWNTVGRPVWHTIGRPIKSILSSVLYLTWFVLSQTIGLLFRTVSSVVTWLWQYGPSSVYESVASVLLWLWSGVTYVASEAVVVDARVVKRKRRRRCCCLCLPLLLLLPLLLMLAGTNIWDRESSLFAIWGDSREKPVLNITENHQYFMQLNEDVQTMILQLQTSQQQQLTAADVEAIVHRILGSQLVGIQADRDTERSQDQAVNLQWRTDQEGILAAMKNQHDDLLANIQSLEATIATQKATMALEGELLKAESSQTLVGLDDQLAALRAELRDLDLENKYLALALRLDDCCKNETFYAGLINDMVNARLAQIMAGTVTGDASQDAFTDWLHTNYMSREALDARLDGLKSDLTATVMEMVRESQENLATQQTIVTGDGDGLGEQQVRIMIQEALSRYSADRTGLADYALESAGGAVVSTRCSETYFIKTAQVSLFGVPLYYVSNSPRTVIQPDVHPGQCWAFRGSEGYIVIQMSTTILPSGFTLEHIPKSLAPTGKIDSAPRNFTVLGLVDEYDKNGVSLGNYTYDDNGSPIQYFPVQVSGDPQPFNMIELKILSNYGNVEYTCLYRFRIHGKPYKP